MTKECLCEDVKILFDNSISGVEGNSEEKDHKHNEGQDSAAQQEQKSHFKDTPK